MCVYVHFVVFHTVFTPCYSNSTCKFMIKINKNQNHRFALADRMASLSCNSGEEWSRTEEKTQKRKCYLTPLVTWDCWDKQDLSLNSFMYAHGVHVSDITRFFPCVYYKLCRNFLLLTANVFFFFAGTHNRCVPLMTFKHILLQATCDPFWRGITIKQCSNY